MLLASSIGCVRYSSDEMEYLRKLDEERTKEWNDILENIKRLDQKIKNYNNTSPN